MDVGGKIRIGISSCLLGNRVRYDGGHQLDHYLIGTLGQYVEYLPVCPEVECGLGTPREAMRLVGSPDNPRLVTRRTGTDYTPQMVRWAKIRVKELEKENSRLRQAVSDLTLDKLILQEAARGNF